MAVCSCTILPLFKGIYKRGSGLGPAISFLYSGPAINVLAIILTAKVLGWKMGLARGVFAVIFSIVIGLIMHFIFKKEDDNRLKEIKPMQAVDSEESSLKKNLFLMGSMIGILIFLNWPKSIGSLYLWDIIFKYKYFICNYFDNIDDNIV